MADQERVFLACDVSNLWKACREEFGDKARVDFQVLSAMVSALRHPQPIQQHLVAYLVTNPKQKHHALANVLHTFGYKVRERFLRYEKGLAKPTRTDWDVGITIDALDRISAYDTFVLVSGDGDFSILLEYLKTRGKRTVVFTFERSTSKSLYESADELHTFTKSIVFNDISIDDGSTT